MVSRTKINQRMRKKTNTYLAEAIFIAKKNKLDDIASAIAVPTRQQAKVNLDRINESKSNIVIIPGKVLSLGDINKKIKIYALGFSEKAKEKLKKAGCEFEHILEGLKKEKKLKGEIIK